MTVGSFVCTTCSGILRGLNPPHRVKSISMTTFTQQEIEFLQKHSNESWLGTVERDIDTLSDVIKKFYLLSSEPSHPVGSEPGRRSTAVPAPPVIPSMQQGFTASTNPFVAAPIPLESMCTNPFQTNNRSSSATGSMSMPSGFSNTPSFCLPTSFSGNFPHPFPPASYHQQPNGGFPVYTQKPQMSYGQPAVSNNPFMCAVSTDEQGGGPASPYSTSGSSTNPFL
ncbi:hypothetical protein Q7C36_000031 [Tachysurus vachellii]|uniref:Arf-GAP domain-containing protein n=1 Tax=Tachysurus vachellii TaxID=175792 RepID=A0AA88TBW7_TACVA|nr:hypothetical protein Q7C36_000031 [Tachysurus vachellii]